MNDKKKVIRVAIAGNPNTGKTSIFNNLTGENQHVGNWPGVTVEKKEGEFTHRGYTVKVVDLPGIYGFSAYSVDERIARDFLLNHEVDLVVNVVDATNLERNLYLNLEFRELGLPMIIALNMMDEVRQKGLEINTRVLSEFLGSDIAETVGREGRGMEGLKDMIVSCYEGGCSQQPYKFAYPDIAENRINKIAAMLEEHFKCAPLLSVKSPAKWFAIELLENEEDVSAKFRSQPWYRQIAEVVDESRKEIQGCSGKDAAEYIIESKYSFLKGLVSEAVKHARKHGRPEGAKTVLERLDVSDRIDSFVTSDIFGVPVFLGVMFLLFFLTFTLGDPLADLIDLAVVSFGGAAGGLLLKAGLPEIFVSLLRDGIIGGVGAVLVFLPNILILFLLIAALEDSGYMSRAAFVTDRFMHKIGLHGKSFIPMVIGFGCNVPAIMATRTLESRKDRIITAMVIPFMSCSARMPIYILFTSAFFVKDKALVVWSLYLLGIVAAAVTAKVMSRAIFKKEDAPLIMEMPPYRVPQPKSLLNHMWFRGKMFVRKAGTVILAGVVIIWVLANFPPGVEYASEKSLIGMLGKLAAPVFAFSGFDHWQAGVALITGVLAKEIVVGTLGALLVVQDVPLQVSLSSLFTPLSAYAFMVFALLYTPCLPTITVIKNELGTKWMLLAVFYNFFVAILASALIFQIGKLFA